MTTPPILNHNSLQQMASQLAGTTVLVAEDSDINRQMIIRILEMAEIKVESAINGQEAVDKVHSGLAALLMDVDMPVLDGLAATRKIRQIPELTTLPIIAMTGFDNEADRQRCLAAGMNDFLAKPINLQKLFATLMQHLGKSTSCRTQQDNRCLAEPALILNSQAGLASLGEDQGFYVDILEDFLRIHAKTTEKIILAWNADNREDALRITHLLKGVAGTIKAEILAEDSRQLEQYLADNHCQPTEIAKQLDRLQTSFSATKQAIHTFLGH